MKWTDVLQVPCSPDKLPRSYRSLLMKSTLCHIRNHQVFSFEPPVSISQQFLSPLALTLSIKPSRSGSSAGAGAADVSARNCTCTCTCTHQYYSLISSGLVFVQVHFPSSLSISSLQIVCQVHSLWLWFWINCWVFYLWHVLVRVK